MTHELLNSPGDHAYARGAAIFTEAAQGFGIPVDENQTQEWTVLLCATHDLDTILDSDLPEADRGARLDDIVSDVLSETSPNIIDGECDPNCAFCQLKVMASDWTDEKKTSLLSIAMHAKEIAIVRRETKRADQLGKLAVFEGRITAGLFSLNSSRNTEKITEYNQWLANLLAAGTAFDTSVDLPRDFSSGLTKVEPTIANRAKVLSVGVPPLTLALKAMKPKMVRPLLGAARAVVNDKL